MVNSNFVNLSEGANAPLRDPPTGLSPAVWREILSRHPLKRLKFREVLFEEGEAVNAVYILTQGQLLLMQNETLMDFAEAGQSIAGAFIGREGSGSTYPISAIAMCKAEVLEISAPSFLVLMEEFLELRQFIQTNIQNRMLFIQSCRAHQKKSVEARLAHILLTKVNVMSSGYVTRKHLAQLVGCSVETVIRVVSDWQKKGIVAVNSRKFQILNKPYMEERWKAPFEVMRTTLSFGK